MPNDPEQVLARHQHHSRTTSEVRDMTLECLGLLRNLTNKLSEAELVDKLGDQRNFLERKPSMERMLVMLKRLGCCVELKIEKPE